MLSTLRDRGVGLLVAGLLVAAPADVASAQTGSFTEPDARVFTLWKPSENASGPSGSIGRLRALPDGSAVFVDNAEPGRTSRSDVWRLALDGRLDRLGWVGPVVGLAVEPRGTLLVIRAGRTALERVNLRTRHRRVVADLAPLNLWSSRWVTTIALAALDDGTIAVAAGTRLFWLQGDRRARVLRLRSAVSALAAHSDGAVTALLDTGAVVQVSRDGARNQIARNVTGGLAPTPSGGLVTVIDGAPAILDPNGTITTQRWGAGVADGRPAAETEWLAPRSLAVAADGSLLLALADGRLRGLVPSGSERARLAVPAPGELLSDGELEFIAAPAGTVALELLRDGIPVARAEAPTSAGRIRLPTTPPPDLYDLRVRLTRPDVQAETRAAVGTRTTLTLGEAGRALTASDGDEFSGVATRGDRCRHLSPASAECLAYDTTWWVHDGDTFGSVEVPSAIVQLTVDPAGEIRGQRQEIKPRPAPPRLKKVHGQVTRAGARVTVTSSHDATLEVKVMVRRADERASLSVAATPRTVSAHEARTIRLTFSSGQRAVLRRWLARRHEIVGAVVVRLVKATSLGHATSVEGKRIPTTSPRD